MSLVFWRAASCFFKILFYFFIERLANFNFLDAIHSFYQKAKANAHFFFHFPFSHSFNIAIAQCFGLSACIPTSHSEPLVTIVTVPFNDTGQ